MWSWHPGAHSSCSVRPLLQFRLCAKENALGPVSGRLSAVLFSTDTDEMHPLPAAGWLCRLDHLLNNKGDAVGAFFTGRTLTLSQKQDSTAGMGARPAAPPCLLLIVTLNSSSSCELAFDPSTHLAQGVSGKGPFSPPFWIRESRGHGAPR